MVVAVGPRVTGSGVGTFEPHGCSTMEAEEWPSASASAGFVEMGSLRALRNPRGYRLGGAPRREVLETVSHVLAEMADPQ